MAAFRIRRAGPADLPAVAALEAACFQPHRRASRASLRRSLASPRQSAWLAEGQGRRPVGLLVLWHFPQTLRIFDVCTDPAARGQGVGGALVAHAEGLARDAGARQVSLEADPREPGLVAWYAKLGYRTVARLPGYYRNGGAAVRMRKVL